MFGGDAVDTLKFPKTPAVLSCVIRGFSEMAESGSPVWTRESIHQGVSV
jgi:hypothetical protein